MIATEQKAEVVPAKKRSLRLPFLDWTRGMAALIMLQGHVFHSFIRNDLRESGPYVISQFIGGIAPAIFLFLTGVTLAFLLDGLDRKAVPRRERVIATLKRAGYLGLLAFVFRIQLWLFAYPQSAWADVFKVDILNCMALAILSMVWLALLTTPERVHAGFLIGGAIAATSPIVSDFSTSLPHWLSMYLAPSGDYFAYFPWASFIAFGVGAGSILRLVSEEHMHRVMQWCAIIGFGLITAGQYFSNLPYSLYRETDFWLNSPGLIVIKLGVILVLLAFTFLWTHHGSGQGWSFVRQIGVTSLLVYWVHIELVYGRWFGALKENLDIAQCALASVVLIILMIGLSRIRTHGKWSHLRMGSALQ